MSQAPKEARKPAPNNGHHAQSQSHSLLAKSAQGATFLIFLQIGSRALTFIVNQILLRFLSPELLGLSTQLELYSISVLYFARESLRVALQRQRSGVDVGSDVNPGNKREEGDDLNDGRGGGNDAKNIAESYAPGRRAQEVVNLSYIAIALGPPLAYLLATLYLRKAEPLVLATPYIHQSLKLYALAAVLELQIEPCFVVAQQQMLYGVRASAEASATLTRCILNCTLAAWANKSGKDLGALPFALGQLSYALVLNITYYGKTRSRASMGGFSLFPKPLKSNSSLYIFSRFYRPTLTLALNLYGQSGLKHLLTQGDSLLIALFTPLSSQGVYALASNYGSLLARILFQPIEESSRGVFGRLLASPPPSKLNTPVPPAVSNKPRQGVLSARTYLSTILHLYSLLSIFIACVGPTISPLLLRYIAGPHWTSTSAGSVLSTYCYYIPLLALNGILEAFVSAVASPAQLRVQSMLMVLFSAGFVGAGYVALRVYELGARGLVLANAVNMGMRIWWSWGFVKGYWRGEGIEWGAEEVLPNRGTSVMGLMVAWYLRRLSKTFDGGFEDLLKTGAVGAGYGVVLLALERDFLRQCYLMLRPPSKSNDPAPSSKMK